MDAPLFIKELLNLEVPGSKKEKFDDFRVFCYPPFSTGIVLNSAAKGRKFICSTIMAICKCADFRHFDLLFHIDIYYYLCTDYKTHFWETEQCVYTLQ